MSELKFVYVTFIRTTPQKLWSALTDPNFTKQYWFGMHHETDWNAGSSWQLVFADGKVHEFEDNLIWRVAELLGVSARDRVLLRKMVASRLGVEAES